MPFPFGYNVATQVFVDVLRAVREETGLATQYQSFTVLEGVLRTFRRRVPVQDSLRFADLLPVPVRALYVHDWDVGPPPVPFGAPATWADEVRALRPRHNSAPDSAVPDVARAMRRFVVAADLDRLLATLPEGAVTFWSGTPA